MADNLQSLSENEIKLECLRIATEFSGEYTRNNPLIKAQEYFDWVMDKRNSSRKSSKTSINKDQL